jgi:nucleotide-binding universal stress UspA family protein/GNAT superfamily N-acetyltransferase
MVNLIIITSILFQKSYPNTGQSDSAVDTKPPQDRAENIPSSILESVLFPSDLSPLSDTIIRTLARSPGIRRFSLVHFITSWSREGAQSQSSLNSQKETFSSINNAPVTVKTENLADKDIPTAILTASSEENASLIVIGARKGILSRSLLSRSATVILTDSKTHVLIMRAPNTPWFGGKATHAEQQDIFSKIIFPTDFSRPANETLQILTKTPGIGEVILLHVIRKVEGDSAAMERTVHEIETRLDRTRTALELSGINVRTVIRFGKPCQQICAAATDEQASMIMMSRYGKMDYLRQIPLGNTTSEVAFHTKVPILVAYTEIHPTISIRELGVDEFYLAEKIWLDYHATKSDPATDRIFCVFVEDTPVSVARCKRHPDGFEVDGVFTWEEFRGKGYARKAMEGLVAACGSEVLYMYAVAHLVNLYSSLGFIPITEKELPANVRKRYAWAMGDMKGTEVCPMKRNSGPQ